MQPFAAIGASSKGEFTPMSVCLKRTDRGSLRAGIFKPQSSSRTAVFGVLEEGRFRFGKAFGSLVPVRSRCIAVQSRNKLWFSKGSRFDS